MIFLRKVRLINWYGFSNETAPIGSFTLIAGKNGNGKSVMLDAIRYAVYGDTVFNKSSENTGSRTISSYTRGLLDATAGTYMRPADKIPNVYTHIVQEYYDEVEEKAFLLGAVIETNAANNCHTLRYVMDGKTMEQMEHIEVRDGMKIPYSALQLQKKYNLTLMQREPGIQKFMQMTGLKLNMTQVSAYLRKLRGIMTYDPNAKLDKFIRESVLEERNVDFSKLIEAKGNIERLHETFHMIQSEIEQLDTILGAYDTCENESNRLRVDDIKIVYRELCNLKEKIDQCSRNQSVAESKSKELRQQAELLEEHRQSLDQRLIQAKVNLSQLDSTQMIQTEKAHLNEIRKEKQQMSLRKDELEHFQTRVSEMMQELYEHQVEAGQKEVLASLCSDRVSSLEKEQAVAELKQLISHTYDQTMEQLVVCNSQIADLDRQLAVQEKILEESRKHRNTYAQIPEYVGLKEEINREFQRRKLHTEAKFACEYVLNVTDEKWRDAVESFLGRRRYTILVEPQYYDIADEILNQSKYKYAHLFNTRLLMEKEISPEEDSVGKFLEIKNAVARKYFDYQLGRMHAVPMNQVRNYENAISPEGRVSVSMDSYFLRFDKIRSYYLGQETFELNRKRAEREIKKLSETRKEALVVRKTITEWKNSLNQSREYFGDYDYDIIPKYQAVLEEEKAVMQQIAKLEKAQKNNSEYMELSQLVEQLSGQLKSIQEERTKNMQELGKLQTEIELCKKSLLSHQENLQKEDAKWKEYKITSYALLQKAVADYDQYIKSGKTGNGGVLMPQTRERLMRSIEQHKQELIAAQAEYGVSHPGSNMPQGMKDRGVYAKRKDKIWMDDLQEIQEKLKEQTRKYEDIFKNEFVLTIFKTCENALDDLKEINRELAQLNFSAKYQFDVHYVKDGSEYAKIIEYARYLDEREQLGGGRSDGQMTFKMFTSISDDEGEVLEQELKKIINRIIEKNSEDIIARFADYRNYMNYEVLMSNEIYDRAKLSRQTGFNSGAEVQIPYLLILSSALLMIYNQKINSTRLVFIDEPFAKMDPANVKQMIDFMKQQNLQVIFCAPDKTESIGNECEVILPVLRTKPDIMRIGIVQFHRSLN